MSQALYTSMSGINTASQQIEVIANNVANINTTAFKASSVNFADVYSTTISYGSVASGRTGGTNPIQIGVGVKTSAITKDFSNGSAVSTGKSTDLMIQGKGFFTVKSADNEIFYTRAGDFSWDNKGNLVTSAGYKVMGTDSIFSTSTSPNQPTVYVPSSLISVVGGNSNIGSRNVADLNGLDTNITSGSFTVVLNNTDGTTTPVTVSLTDANLASDVDTMVGVISGQLSAQGVTCEVGSGDTAGQIVFKIGDPTTVKSLSFGASGDTSNFITATDIGNSVLDPATSTYKTKVLDYSCSITDVTSAAEATSVNSITINQDGSIQSTYQNGDTLSVQLKADGQTYEFVYTTAEGVAISGESLSVNQNVAVPANYVIQMATVTNQDGLLSVGSNLFEAGPNSGTITYTVGNNMGAGAISSGYLESSNVDLSEELSNMILAQRAVQANSRVFTTTSDVLQTITQMGR